MINAEESYKAEENRSPLQLDSYDEELEETLSLCDLPIYTDDLYSKDHKDQSSSFDENDDFFEFFSEDFTASTYPSAENIIFCGELIPYKEPPQPEKTQILEIAKPNKTTRKKSLFRRKSSGNGTNSSRTKQVKSSRSLSLDRDVSVGKGLISAPSPAVRSKWYLFMFGMGIRINVPMEMELRDMKTRQLKRTPSTMFQYSSSFSLNNNESEIVERKKKGGKGSWGIFRALGCMSRHANNIVNVV